MDLYEALKSGTSYDDLLSGFRADLDEAFERLCKEESDNVSLIEAREDLANSLFNYVEVLYSKDTPLSDEYYDIILKSLEDYEQEVKGLVNIARKLEKAKEKNPNLETNIKLDLDDLVNEFLKAFK